MITIDDEQDKSVYNDLCSPSMSEEAVMMVLGIASADDRYILTCDVTGAFMETEMPAHQDAII